MEIINKNNGENVNCVCNFCNSELKVNTFDLKYGFLNVYFKCPVCNRKIVVPDEKLYLFGLKLDY